MRLDEAKAWWRRRLHDRDHLAPRPLLPRLAALVERAPRWLPAGKWRMVLAGPAVAGLWLLAYWQANVPGADSQQLGLVTALATIPLLASRQRPLLAWAPVTLGVSILAGSHPVLPIGAVIGLLVALYSIGVRSSRLVAIGAGVLSGLALLPMIGNDQRVGVPLPLPLTVSLIVAVLALADQVGTRRLTERALAERAEEYRMEQARRAVLEERSRIARELHDVVAHHMSMVAVQAETAPYRIQGLPEAGLRDFATIGQTAREALTEMRRLLGVLRSDDETPERVPQPGLAHLDELVEVARGAGLPVRTTVQGQHRPLPAGVELSAYRIVQEALSNAGQHAEGVRLVDVVVAYEPDRLLVTVTDDGHGRAGPPGPPGHGLVGMSERVAMLGGTITAGPGPDGGFQVAAVLPVPPVPPVAPSDGEPS
jgi:signal transduction histidine kinase